MNPEDLIRQLKQILPALLGERPVMIAYLYGSIASGRTTPFSDVDIALVLKLDHGLSKYEQLMMSLTIPVLEMMRKAYFAREEAALREAGFYD